MIQPLTISVFFKAVADPTRLRILHLLNCEELTVSELVRVLDMPQSSVSRHLKILREAGLITDRAAGPATFYRTELSVEPEAPDGALRRDLLALLAPDQLAPALREALERVVALRAPESESFFDRIAAHWDALREDCFGPTFHLEALVHMLPAGWRVADLGTGTGYLLPVLARHFRRVIAVDSSRGMLELAARRVAEAGLGNVELREGDLAHLPLAADEIDFALLVLILHHLADARPAVYELGRVLAPAGQALILEYYPYDNEVFRRRMSDRRPGLDPEFLRALLAEAGFGEFGLWDVPTPARPDHALAPLPRLYCMTARKARVWPTQGGWTEKEP
jgi:ArsR family transcriptional regulator